MENKITYRAPELEITRFTACDIVTASFGSDNGFDGETDTDW
jgi:hypothetical protein